MKSYLKIELLFLSWLVMICQPAVMAEVKDSRETNRFLNVFRRSNVETATISPDEKHIAYSVRENENHFIWIREISAIGKVKAKIAVGGIISKINWVSGKRFIASVSYSLLPVNEQPYYYEPLPAALISTDLDGSNYAEVWKQGRKVVSGKGSYPDGVYPNLILVQSDAPDICYLRFTENTQSDNAENKKIYSTWGLKINTLTNARERLNSDKWRLLEPKLREAEKRQQENEKLAKINLEKIKPGRAFHIFASHPESSGRFYAAKVSSPTDPGVLCVYDSEKQILFEFSSCSNELSKSNLHKSELVEQKREGGDYCSGILTVPGMSRVKAPPLVVLLPEKATTKNNFAYVPLVRVLADMGFAILQLDGWGRKTQGASKLSNQAWQYINLVNALDALKLKPQINANRVALVGNHIFRYKMELTMMLLGDSRIKCGSVVMLFDKADDPFMKIAAIMDEVAQKTELLKSEYNIKSKTDKPSKLLMLRDEMDIVPFGTNDYKNHIKVLMKHNIVGSVAWVPQSIGAWMQADRQADIFRRVEIFLNENLYEFNVKIGDLLVMPDDKNDDSPSKPTD